MYSSWVCHLPQSAKKRQFSWWTWWSSPPAQCALTYLKTFLQYVREFMNSVSSYCLTCVPWFISVLLESLLIPDTSRTLQAKGKFSLKKRRNWPIYFQSIRNKVMLSVSGQFHSGGCYFWSVLPGTAVHVTGFMAAGESWTCVQHSTSTWVYFCTSGCIL